MIRAVIFDIGGVLVRTEDNAGRRRIEQRYGFAPGGAEQLVFNSAMGQKAQAGEVTTEQLWQWVQHEIGLSDAALGEFRREFWSGDQMDGALVDYIRALRGRYKTAIISNALDNLSWLITEEYPMADAFDVVIGSADEKVMKPAPAIFHLALARLACQPQEAIFVDDFLHNVDGARAVGMHGLHYTRGLDVPAALAAFGVTP